MSNIFAFGIGVCAVDKNGNSLDALFNQPIINLSETDSDTINKAISSVSMTIKEGKLVEALTADQRANLAAALKKNLPSQAALLESLASSSQRVVAVLLESDSSPATVEEAYLKLQLLSHRLAFPHSLNLDGIFACLPNVAWTNQGPIAIDELPSKQVEARANGDWLSVNSIDKFPKMTDYVVPSGVRIAHTARVRLGAHIGEGTTIMHEGFVNFNAGTAGTSMIEGRISAGVFVGEGSDLGGGCSTMGTLSGGGNVVISVGQNCLIGANAGVGIALGDRCIVEAGLYITAGTIVTMLDQDGVTSMKVKARELSGKSDLLFRRNSVNGAVECKTNKSVVELNEALHSNN